MTRMMLTLTLTALAFFWTYWAQQAPRYYYPRPAAQPTVTTPACPGGRCCFGGRCQLAQPKDLPKPPAVKMAGDTEKVK